MAMNMLATRNESQIRVPLQTETVNPRLEFRDGQWLYAWTNGEGGLHEKLLSDAAVREIFSRVPVDTKWFNEDVASPAVVRWGDGRLGPWAVFFVPPARHTLELTNDGSGEPYAVERVTAPLPGVALFGIDTDYYAFALRTETLRPYNEVCRCPLPNVMQDGKVCWGMIPPPRATAQTIGEAWRLFVGSTFNNHVANAKSRRHPADVRALLKELAAEGEAARYPPDDLVRQSEAGGMTLDRAVREFFEGKGMPGQ